MYSLCKSEVCGIMFNLACQLDWIWSQLGDTSLDSSVEALPERLRERLTHHCAGGALPAVAQMKEARMKHPGAWVPAFASGCVCPCWCYCWCHHHWHQTPLSSYSASVVCRQPLSNAPACGIQPHLEPVFILSVLFL